MRDSSILFCCLILLFFTGKASGITCLSCTGVIQPRYCTTVRQCSNHTTCGVQKYQTLSGEIRYDVDCVSTEVCPRPFTIRRESEDSDKKARSGPIINSLCSECCHGNLCNSQGCGQIGYPSSRGPICYSCEQETDPARCEKISFCRSDESCGIIEENFFNTKIYSSRCVSKYQCNLVRQPGIAIGKRGIRQLSEHMCGVCCESDLCNDQCRFPANVSYTTHPPRPTSTHPPRPTSPQIAHAYKLFLVMFQASFSNSGILELLVASRSNGSLEIEMPRGLASSNKTHQQISAGYNAYNFSAYIFQGRGSEVKRKAIYLNSSVPISVFGMSQWYGSAEAYNALPVEALGTRYRVVSYQPSQDESELMIAPIYNQTNVTIFFVNHTRPSVPSRLSCTTVGSQRVCSGILNRLETLHIQYGNDLTGTKIVSDKPVGVLSGTQCTHVIGHVGDCQPLVAYQLPVKHWGNRFIVPSIDHAPKHVIKIWPDERDTHLKVINSRNATVSYTVQPDAGQSITYQSSSLPLYIESDKPIMVTALSSENSAVEASMFSVPPMRIYDSSYSVALPQVGNYSNKLMLVGDRNTLNGATINGQSVRGKGVMKTTGNNYATITVDVKEKHAFIESNPPGQDFGAFAYGISGGQYPLVYSFPAGMKFPVDF